MEEPRVGDAWADTTPFPRGVPPRGWWSRNSVKIGPSGTLALGCRVPKCTGAFGLVPPQGGQIWGLGVSAQTGTNWVEWTWKKMRLQKCPKSMAGLLCSHHQRVQASCRVITSTNFKKPNRCQRPPLFGGIITRHRVCPAIPQQFCRVGVGTHGLNPALGGKPPT